MTSVHMLPREPAATHQVYFNNDPSAGSPTETLLRLLLPLNAQVCISSHRRRQVAPP